MVKYIFGIFALIVSAAPSSFADGSCVQFSGSYTVSSAGCYEAHDGGTYSDSVYNGMVISADASNNLSMHYKTDGESGFTVNYIADGQQHNGDINNSGKTYTATCDANQISSTRVGMFIAPFVMTFVKNSDGTYTLTETITGDRPFTRSCSMVRGQ